MQAYTASPTSTCFPRHLSAKIAETHSPKTRMVPPAQVTLQHDTLEGVVGGDAYYGATVGRVCNRIAGASFSGGPSRNLF